MEDKEEDDSTEIYRNTEALDKIGELIPEAAGFPEARYFYDTRLKESEGWLQFDTHQDAWYFGCWVNRRLRMTVCFAEGDVSLVVCRDDDAFRKQIEEMVEFYGDPPAAFVTFGDDGRTEYRDYRSRRIFEED